MDLGDIQANYPAIDAASKDMLALFGPGYTGRPQGHIETDIAGAASMAGLMILRSKISDLSQFTTGTVILMDIEEDMNLLWEFLMVVAYNLGLAKGGWDAKVPQEHKPLYPVQDMTRKLEKDFYGVCEKHETAKEYYRFVAALTALKLVSAGDRMKMLDQGIGKPLAAYHVVAGAKTVPYPLDAK